MRKASPRIDSLVVGYNMNNITRKDNYMLKKLMTEWAERENLHLYISANGTRVHITLHNIDIIRVDDWYLIMDENGNGVDIRTTAEVSEDGLSICDGEIKVDVLDM